MNATFGSIPQMIRGPEVPGLQPLFHSVRDIALVIDKTAQAGYGVLKGGWTGLKRLFRCHPWGSSGFDPVP